MRVSTACYLERMGAGAFPWIFMRMQGFIEMLWGRNLDVWDEADTWPQNAWSKSARSFFTHLAAADFCGMKGAKTWYVNAVRANGVPVTKAYTDILAENRGERLQPNGAWRKVDGPVPVGFYEAVVLRVK